MIVKDVLAGFVDVGLHPTPGLRIVKRPVGMLHAKGNGIERNVRNGTRKTRIILGPITCRRNLMLLPHLRKPQKSYM
ncbi:MAG: hypothetical protein JSV50_09515 [Desulfobacteraceae bacterium]|nr:MAG: hypothetical protein JSV50_09515 [Desulfobacteraceae bacterium]